ncbi:ABC transporter permease [Novosphingobium lentum]|uniref:ABC transporter permease n=1 Tax=Novosphingobium lentum TaxID=145287 RepID=UPI00083001FA|nr:ABC transporter permease [Novosphingobium lentum]
MNSKLRSIWVIARRDFLAVIMRKSFLLFLLSPLFPVLVGAMAGNIGAKVSQDLDRPQVGVAMAGDDGQALIAARNDFAEELGGAVPELVPLKQQPDAAGHFDARAALHSGGNQLAAVVSGTLAAPVLTGTSERLGQWQGLMAMIAARAAVANPQDFPDVRTQVVATSAAKENNGRVMTAQGAQTLLFLLTMLLAGMVLSNLVEEKGNKIIEVLAAAIPMDALFLGKLFAMLGVSLVFIGVWGVVGSVAVEFGGKALPVLATPAVGWPLFFVLGFLYFAMAYLLLGSLFLSIGGMASTVREVQTLSMPVTMLQLMVFFFASYALTQQGTWVEWLALAVPFSSPFTMLARAAQEPALWPHLVALAYQVVWVMVIVRTGAMVFRRTVMKSGAARGRANKPPLLTRLGLRRAKPAAASAQAY